MKKHYKFLAIFSLFLVYSLPVYAQQAMSGVLVHSSNVYEYKGKIPLELYALVRGGGLVLDRVENLNFQIAYGDDWQRGQEESVQLDENGGLKILEPLKNGFVYDVAKIDLKEDPKKNIEKILWNIQSVNWAKPLSRYQFNLRVIREDRIIRELQGSLERLYNWRLVSEDKTAQFFRELVAVNKPDVLNNYTWLTYRFFGKEEDLVWVYSPAIKKSRELTGSNRSDAFAGVMATDDFLLWSGKLENVEGATIKEVEILEPVASNTVTSLQKSADGCFAIKDSFALADLATRWNYGSRKYAQGASWLPTDAVYVLRKAYKIDLLSRDPYSQYGRQTLYVDKESSLPIYKFVYDRSGQLWKSMLMFYGFATDEANQQVPYASQMLIIDEKLAASVMVDYFDVHYCSTFPEKYDASKFDPRKFAGQAEKTTAKNAPAKK